MKKLLSLLLVCLILLAGCQQTGQAAFHFRDLASKGTFAYPGTQWNMTPAEVTKALGLKEEQFQQVGESTGNDVTDRVFLVEQPAVSGLPSDVYFWFRSCGGDSEFGLKSVTWMFDEAADMEKLQAELEESFGNPAKVHSQYPLSYWYSGDKLSESLDEQILEYLKTNRSELFQQIENEAAVSLVLVNNPDTALPVAALPAVGANAKMVILSSNLADVLQLQGA